jgi:Domain of unknown function (DUF222)
MDGASLTFVGPLVAALEAVGEALDDAAGADVWSLSDDDLAAAIARCEVVAARQAAVGLRLVREAEARDLGRRLGAASTVGWLRHRLRLRPGEAKTRVDLAHRLRVGESDSGPVDYAANVTSAGGRSMPATAAALAAGQVSVDHASVIATTMAELPGGLSVEQERVAESTLAGWAREHDPVTVGRLGRHLVHALDADTLEQREQRAFARRQLRFSEAGDGSTRISGRLDGESAAMVRAVLDPLAAPCPAADGTQDPRTAGQRSADALVELARRACTTGRLPAGHGVRPHLSVIITLESLLTQPSHHRRCRRHRPVRHRRSTRRRWARRWRRVRRRLRPARYRAGGGGLGRADLGRGGAADRLRRRHHPGDRRPGVGPPRRRPRTAHRHRRAVGRSGGP